jgi:S-adenosylmethionine:tRNA ribosyltransferase-isomerase
MNILTEDFNYNLPEERIAKFPLKNREDSKLLIYKNGVINESKFKKIATHLPQDSLLVFNNTKVINARLIFKKETGAKIEIFCLNPFSPIEYSQALASKNQCSWECMIGNLKKWKDNQLSLELEFAGKQEKVYARKSESKTENGFVVDFSWGFDASFGEILDAIGILPIPPYLNRKTEESDKQTYQTVYSKNEGSVAAPTAGLHFTNNIINEIHQNSIQTQELTLHVGAGTFKPISSENVAEHEMHHEYFTVTKNCLKSLIQNRGKIIAVGTTSLRTLESIYWIGVKIHNNLVKEGEAVLQLNQWENTKMNEIPFKDSIDAIMAYLKRNDLENLCAETQIMVVPGYKFKTISYLVTNFHQPKSTLLLLISAIMGDFWKEFYQYALDNEFRFLSYGDSSLLTIDS